MSKYKKTMKGVKQTTGLLITENIGYNVAGKIAGLDTTGVGTKAFQTGSSLAGIPSLAYGSKTVLDSLSMLDVEKKRRKR